jgi:hypothetical protein
MQFAPHQRCVLRLIKEVLMDGQLGTLRNVSAEWRRHGLVALASTCLLASAAAAQPPDRGPAERAGERLDERVETVDHAIEGYVSEDALQLQYIRDLRIEGFGPVEARAGVFYNEQRDLLGMVDLLVDLGDQANRRRIEVNVGTRLYGAFLNTENEDTFSVGFGGEAQLFLSRDQRMSVKVAAFYGPDILTFGIADNIQDVSARFQMRVRDGTDIFVGYRSLEIETFTATREIDDNLHVGFRRVF